jgi:multidrug resistance efflux pump
MLVLLSAIGGLVWYYGFRPVGDLVITGIVTTDDVTVSSQVQGRIKELKVQEGSVVKKGDLLATIENDEWQKDMDYYVQAEEQARRQVSEAQAMLRFEQSQTDSQIAQAQANLASAEAQITQSQADLENARLTYVHEQEAFNKGAESQQMFDQARTTYDAQKARLESVQKLRDAAKAGVDVAKANAEQVKQRQAAVEMARAQLLAATAQKEKAGVQLGYTEIRAPIDGIVDTRTALQGEVVNPMLSGAIVTLIDPDNLWVRADVEESYIERIHLGDVLKVRFPSGAEKDGTVYYRSVDADYATKRDVKTFEVRLRCDNKDRAMAVGMTAYITLPAGKK